MAIKPKTMTTQEYVKKEAEAKCNNWLGIGAYEDGLSTGIELAKAFGEWVDSKMWRLHKSKWFQFGKHDRTLTTSELFEIFLTERNEK